MISSRTADRLARILSMLPWVIANPGASVDEVAARFGYTPKELAADLNVIFVCGLPGYGPGDLMDAYIDEDEVIVDMADYFAASPRLTSAEALTLLASGMALLSAGLASEPLERGVAKLQQSLLPEGDDALVIDLMEPPLLVELRQAVSSHRTVAITYTGLASGQTTERVIEPWSVFAALGNWYVRGHCRLAAAERVFRVDRIRQAEVLDETFQPPAESPEPVIDYSPGVDDTYAVIRLAPQARWVADYYPVDVIEESPEGLTVRFSAATALVAARLLVRLGSAGELLEGEEVAAAVGDLRGRILTRYRASAD
jgi:proteasome accessory factor C